MSEEKKYGYIYKTTNLINGKIYIGQHKYGKNDKRYIGGGTLLKKSIEKYGKNNFKCEIIEELDSLKELNEREIYWISFYNSTDKNIGYNIERGGNLGPTSDSTKKKLSKALSGKNNPMYGKTSPLKDKKLSEESKKKISESLKGFKHTEETKKKMSKSHKGIIFSEEHRKKLSEINKGENNYWYNKVGPRKGIILSKEVKEKISKAHQNKKLSEDHKRNISKSITGEKNPMFGKKHSEESKQKMRQSALNRKRKNNNENNNL